MYWYRLALRKILFLGRCQRAAESLANTVLRQTAPAKLSHCCAGAFPGSQLLMNSLERPFLLACCVPLLPLQETQAPLEHSDFSLNL